MDVTAKPSWRGLRGQVLKGAQRVSVRRAFHDNPLLLLLLAAILVRALAAVFFSGAIGSEGAEYARIAQSLLAGDGYQGIAEEGTQLFFPPLFPLAIAGLSLLTGDAEIAGRVLSVIFGGLVVLPVYFIVSRMYDRRAALIAAALVGLHPYLIYLSTTVNSEAMFVTLVLAAIALAMAAIADATPRNALAAGAMYGLAYLVRPEAALYMLISAALVFLHGLGRQGLSALASGARAGLLIAAFVVVAAPYVGWLSLQTGQFRIEGKSPLNIQTGWRIQLGENPARAQFGLDEAGNESGVWNRPNIDIIKEHNLSFNELLTYLRQKSKSVLENASQAVAGTLAFGSPALFGLAVLGFFARPWSLTLGVYQLQLVSVLALSMLGTYFIYYTSERFYVLLIPCLSIWAAVGLGRVAQWAKETGAEMGVPGRLRSSITALTVCVALAAVLVPSAAVAASMLRGARATYPIKEAGEKIRATMRPPARVLDTQTTISFHAGASHVWMPYADEAAAIDYIKKKGIDFVVVRKSDAPTRPYLEKWAESGLPLPGAKLVDTFDIGTWETVRIYRVDGDGDG